MVNCLTGDQKSALIKRGTLYEDAVGGMRMLELGCELNLASESLDVYRRCKVGRKYLDHHLSAERSLLGDEDAQHAATTELTLNGVVVAERALKLLL